MKVKLDLKRSEYEDIVNRTIESLKLAYKRIKEAIQVNFDDGTIIEVEEHIDENDACGVMCGAEAAMTINALLPNGKRLYYGHRYLDPSKDNEVFFDVNPREIADDIKRFINETLESNNRSIEKRRANYLELKKEFEPEAI